MQSDLVILVLEWLRELLLIRILQKLLNLCSDGKSGRFGDLDTTVIYLESYASTFITGQIITADGGWTAI
jgi:NAD(P)-dependent dehydrogenase (short-subunit alcohol dehydrogenase family)